jgi:hypothetical protein
MNIKQYLSQALYLDERINSKLEQVHSLREMATKANAVISDAPPSGTRNFHRLEDVICKMIDLENEINADIENLIKLKQEIGVLINAVPNPTYRTLLELRYLCFKTWDAIAGIMHYDRRYVLKVHGRALQEADTKGHY